MIIIPLNNMPEFESPEQAQAFAIYQQAVMELIKLQPCRDVLRLANQPLAQIGLHMHIAALFSNGISPENAARDINTSVMEAYYSMLMEMPLDGPGH